MKSEARHGGQAEGDVCFTLAPDRTIIRLGRSPSWEAGRGANNYSGARNAAPRSARQNEQLFAIHTAWKLRRTTKKTANWRGKRGHRHRTSPNPKSESEPDNPTGQARPSTPHRTHQVFTLFLGFYVIMLYRMWVCVGLCGCFHSFLCK